jgi:colanic acid biosynthesis glycosyl transferase WcaI
LSVSRVLVVSHYYDPEPLPKAGELARALVDRGHEVRVVTGLPTYPAGDLYDGYRFGLRRTSVDAGVPVTRTLEIPYHGRSPIGRAANYASTGISMSLGWPRGWAPDAVYVWSPPPTSVLPAHILARAGRGYVRRAGRGSNRRPRIVMDIQDLWPDFGILAGLLQESRSVEVLRWLERAAYRRADRLVVPTAGYRDAIVGKGISGERIEVIPNWIPDEDAVAPDPATVDAARRAEGWDGRFVVLFAGNLGNAQGLETVIDAAARSDDPEVVWAFAGDGTDRHRLAELAAQRGISDRVQFLGRRDPATMPALAGAADVLLVHLRPSPLADVVVPTKLNGYLAYGRPILCALGGEGAALLQRAEAGIAVAPGDAAALVAGLRELRALDASDRAAMGARGRAFARRELVRSSLLDRYEAVLGVDGPDAFGSAVRPSSGRSIPTDADATATATGTPAVAHGRMLVTGATGSIGPAVVATALASGWTVRVLVRRTVAFPDDVEVAVGDIRDPDSVRAAVAGCDVVVHLAGVAHRSGPGTDDDHRSITRDGARTVFAQAEAAGCERVVFASSISVYGREGTFDEHSPLQPMTTYGAAKADAEADLRTRIAPDGRPLGTIVRLATCYGPGAAGNVTTMLDALDRRRFAVVGSGRNRKTLLHITDAAAALVLVAASPEAAGATYDVSDGCPLPLREVVDQMCSVLGRPAPPRIPVTPLRLALRVAEGAARSIGRPAPIDGALVDTLVADVAVPALHIRDELGFVVAHDLSSGLATMVGDRRDTDPTGGRPNDGAGG